MNICVHESSSLPLPLMWRRGPVLTRRGSGPARITKTGVEGVSGMEHAPFGKDRKMRCPNGGPREPRASAEPNAEVSHS